MYLVVHHWVHSAWRKADDLFTLAMYHQRSSQGMQLKKTRSHREMVGDMSRVTLNFDLSKLPFMNF